MHAGPRTYHFEHLLGRGGSGEVYLATMTTHGGLERRVAVKLLNEDALLDQEALGRLRDEGRLLASLNHPNIVAIDDIVQLDGRWGLVTEYVEGQDLSTVLSEGHRFSPKAALHLVSDVASALDAAWYTPAFATKAPLCLVHRDVKPANIRIARTGTVKLLDFGIATGRMQREAHTQAGRIYGTLRYIAPERFLNGDMGAAGDVYALGCVLYEAMAGEPFMDVDRPSMVAAIMGDPDVHAELVERRIFDLRVPPDPAVAALLRQLLRHDPAGRPSPAEIARLADSLFSQLPGGCLRQWSRDFAWPELDHEPSDLDGHTLTLDGADPTQWTARVAGTLPGAPVRKRSRVALVLGVGLALAGLAVAAGAVVVIVAIALALMLA